MPAIPPDVEQVLADMSPGDWDTFVAKVRAPDRAEAFRETASKFIGGDRLDAICSVVNASLYVDAHGEIDAGKVEHQLRQMFDIAPGPSHENFGQYTPAPTFPGRGDAGAAEAQKRFGSKDAQAAPTSGNAGAAEASRRFGQGQN